MTPTKTHRARRAAGSRGAAALAPVLAVAALAAACERGPATLRVITDRTESNVAPIFAAYAKATGVRIEPVYLEKGLISRLESRPTEADIVITRDADLLEIARTKGLLQPLASKRIEAVVPAEFRDPAGTYFSDSYRARVIFYSRDRVRPDELATYEDLGAERWKGRVCIRSGYHDYNLNFFGQYLVKNGPERTRELLERLKANLAAAPAGNDRDQAKAIFENRCDLAVMNSYYMGIMLSSPDQRPWGLATRVFFPDQQGCGAFILRSGLALTKATRDVEAARSFLEYVVQENAQDYMSKLTYAYPVRGRGPLPEITRSLGEGQPGVSDGSFKICKVPLDAVAAQRDAVIRMLDEIRFDQRP